MNQETDPTRIAIMASLKVRANDVNDDPIVPAFMLFERLRDDYDSEPSTFKAMRQVYEQGIEMFPDRESEISGYMSDLDRMESAEHSWTTSREDDESGPVVLDEEQELEMKNFEEDDSSYDAAKMYEKLHTGPFVGFPPHSKIEIQE